MPAARPVIPVLHELHRTFLSSRWPLVALAAALAVLLAPPAHAQEFEPLPPELEPRAQALYDSVMCPQCAGQTISQSNSQIARAMREAVRDGLLAGESSQQILDALVVSFGEGILASPPKRGLSLLVWLAPPIALILGGAAVALAVRRLRRGTAPAVSPAGNKATGDLAPYLDMVDREIGGGGRGPSPSA